VTPVALGVGSCYIGDILEKYEVHRELFNLPEAQWETRQRAVSMDDGQWDCLVRSGPGRYLWLKLELRGNGRATPELSAVTIEFPRISLRRYLPAVFGVEAVSADFTDRFLSLFAVQ